MSAKYTPGPWTIGECLYGEYDESDGMSEAVRGYLVICASDTAPPSGDHVAIVMGADKNYTSHPAGAANARVIAEAPAMVEALRRSAERFEVIAEWCDRQFIASRGTALLDEIRKDCKSNASSLLGILARIEGSQ